MSYNFVMSLTDEIAGTKFTPLLLE